jgi:SAM-dependent methyltransferase
MTQEHQVNQEQVALWNNAAGSAWTQMQSLLDRVLEPFNKLLIEHSLQSEKCRVLDIGCGAGSTTLSVARRLGEGGLCLGVDISAMLLEAAKKRAIEQRLDKAVFVQADAQTYAFEPNSFDVVLSRFGVMFFADPEAAFVNIRHAAREGATLNFVAWRSPSENPFMTQAARAAAPFLPSLSPPPPNTPGQFGFADADRVRRILQAAGWKHIDIRPVDVPIQMAEPDLLAYVTTMGPAGLAMREVDDPTRARIAEAVRAAFDPFVRDGVAHFNAACWLVSARAS